MVMQQTRRFINTAGWKETASGDSGLQYPGHMGGLDQGCRGHNNCALKSARKRAPTEAVGGRAPVASSEISPKSVPTAIAVPQTTEEEQRRMPCDRGERSGLGWSHVVQTAPTFGLSVLRAELLDHFHLPRRYA
jgi:hypothetical protein